MSSWKRNHDQEDQSQSVDLWLLEEICTDCEAWGTSHTFDDEGDEVLVRPEPWAEAANSLKDRCEVALAEMEYRLRNVYTGETVSERAVLRSLGWVREGARCTAGR